MATDVVRIESDYLNQWMRCKYNDLWLDIPMDEFDDIKQNTRDIEHTKEVIKQLICNRNGKSAESSRKQSERSHTEYDAILRELDHLKERQYREELEGAYDSSGNTASIRSKIRIHQLEGKLAHYREQEYYRNSKAGYSGTRGANKTPSYDDDDWQDAASYKDWFKQHTQEKPEDKIMANKFLPFIVEKSAPDHIYRTLLSRSKGMNINLVTSIFWMVADKGVTELREFVKSLPDGLSVTQMYEEMVGKYSQYQIFDDNLSIFTDLSNHFTVEDWQKFDADLIKELDPKDILAFIFVMYKLGNVEKWTDLNFPVLIGNVDNVLSDIGDYALFADDGEAIEFYSDNDLKAFILYQALLKFSDGSTMSSPIKVVFVEKPKDDTPF